MSSRIRFAAYSAAARAFSAPVAAPAPVGRMTAPTMFFSRSKITASVLVEPLSTPSI